MKCLLSFLILLFQSVGEAVRRAVLAETGVWPLGTIQLIANLRTFGYCLNPISVFLCWSGGDEHDNRQHSSSRPRVEFIVTEVTSTPWEQRVVHVLDLREQATRKKKTMEQKKENDRVFTRTKTIHVSPFNPVPDGDQLWECT